ncbi:MAG: type II toxin-antitoxin system PemK/MazF family toxin [Candidatus Parcubacteria bacterium]|nr:type II toxin-antitoxin system PemK/MazF family toxin [Candidatus Parcubacteria bacterium]
MKKDFENWHKIKSEIHENERSKRYHAREVWWCSIGANIGFEQDGDGSEYQRPVLILKGLSKDTCLVIPLTTSPNKHPMRIQAGIVGEKNASVIISQLRVVDTKRLTNKLGFIEKDIFENIRKAVKDML